MRHHSSGYETWFDGAARTLKLMAMLGDMCTKKQLQSSYRLQEMTNNFEEANKRKSKKIYSRAPPPVFKTLTSGKDLACLKIWRPALLARNHAASLATQLSHGMI